MARQPSCSRLDIYSACKSEQMHAHTNIHIHESKASFRKVPPAKVAKSPIAIDFLSYPLAAEAIALLRHMLSRFLCPPTVSSHLSSPLWHAVPVVATSNVNSDLTDPQKACKRFRLEHTQRAERINSGKIPFLSHCVKKLAIDGHQEAWIQKAKGSGA